MLPSQSANGHEPGNGEPQSLVAPWLGVSWRMVPMLRAGPPQPPWKIPSSQLPALLSVYWLGARYFSPRRMTLRSRR